MAIRSALTLCFTAALLGSTAAMAQSRDGGDIIVTATPLSETARLLADCIARNCPPAEDIAATLRHAENQFVAGEYDAARSTLNEAIRRNRNQRLNLPVEVAGLYRATSRVSAHLGDPRAYELGVINMRETLRDGLPADDERQLHAEIEVADAQRSLGYLNYARDRYRAVADRAQFAGHDRTAAFAQLRLVSMDLPTERSDAAMQGSRRAREAERLLQRIVGRGIAVGADVSFLARTLLARVERARGDMTRTNELLAEFAATSPGSRPLLIHSRQIILHDADQTMTNEDPFAAVFAVASAGGGRVLTSENNLSRMQMSDITGRWIDVGFWIEPDGRVRDVEVLRSSGDAAWARHVETAIRSRAYTPSQTAQRESSPGTYIVERYTLTARMRTDCTGSRLNCRDPRLRVEMMDLTPEIAAATASGTDGPA
jgi:TonB family protein